MVEGGCSGMGRVKKNPTKISKEEKAMASLEVSFTFIIRVGKACLISLVLVTLSFPFCWRIRKAVVPGYQYPEASVPWLRSGSHATFSMLECGVKNEYVAFKREKCYYNSCKNLLFQLMGSLPLDEQIGSGKIRFQFPLTRLAWNTFADGCDCCLLWSTAGVGTSASLMLQQGFQWWGIPGWCSPFCPPPVPIGILSLDIGMLHMQAWSFQGRDPSQASSCVLQAWVDL